MQAAKLYHSILSPLMPLALFGLFASAPAQEAWVSPRLTLWYSDNLNPKSGGDDLLSVHYGFARLEDAILPLSPWSENGWIEKTGAIGYRFLRLNFVEFNLLSFFTAVPQHEIFGHGYRAREFHFEDIRYEFSPPWPYSHGSGSGGGLTRFSYSPMNFTPDREIALATSGVEASALMAGKIRRYWMLAGNMDYHRALLYTLTAGDLRNYLDQTDEKKLDTDPDLSNDMLTYIQVLNEKAGRSQRQNFKLHLSRIHKQSQTAILDPFLWYSYWTLLKTHLWAGQSTFGFPSIPLGPIRYLPLLGYGLTPWGPEYQIENMAAWESKIFTWTIRIGEDTFREFWGMDLEAMNLISLLGTDLDLGLHIWRQPRLRLDIMDRKTVPLQFGGAGSLDLFSPDLGLAFPMRLAGGIDYKSSGFLPGSNLNEGLTWRFGLDIPL